MLLKERRDWEPEMECGIVIMYKISNSRDLVKFSLNTHTHIPFFFFFFALLVHITSKKGFGCEPPLLLITVNLHYTQPRIKYTRKHG